MKKLLLFAAAAMMAFASCEKITPDIPETPDKPVEPEVPEVIDEISVDPVSDEVTMEAKIFEVIVTSTGDWTMEPAAEYDWVTASAKEGKDGDIVKFSVSENYDVDRTAEFTFTCGKATAKYTLVSKAGELVLPKISLLNSEKPEFLIEQPWAQSYTVVEVAAENIQTDGFNVNITAGAEWLEMMIKQQKPGAPAGDTQIYLQTKDQNNSGAERTATVEITAEGCEPLVVTVKQSRLETITLSKTEDIIEAAGQLVVNVTSSSDWTMTPVAEYTWVKASATSGKNGDSVTFDVTEFTAGETATFEFAIGQIKATYTIICKSAASDLTKIEVISNSPLASYASAFGTLTVSADGISGNMYTVNIKTGSDWLTFLGWGPGAVEGAFDLYLEAASDNTTGAERVAEVEVSAPGCETILVQVKQEAQ